MGVDVLDGRVHRGARAPAARHRVGLLVSWLLTHFVTLAAAVLAVLGAWLVVYTTRHGMTTHGDSGAYYGVAANLRNGRGLTTPFDLATDRYSPLTVWRFAGAVPSTHYPPLYPVALVAAAAGGSIWNGARALGVLTMGANLFLATMLAARLLPRRRRALALMVPVVVSAPLGNPPGWVIQHATVGSEPLFDAFLLGALLAFGRWLERRDRASLATACGLTSAALLTRHVGLFLVVLLAGALVVVERRGGALRPARRAAIFAGAAMTPWIGYLTWGYLAGGSSGGALRELRYHPMGGLREATIRVVSMWFFSPRWSDAVRFPALGALAGAALVVFVATRTRRHARWPGALARPQRVEQQLLALVAAAVGVYWLWVVLSRTFSDASIPIDDRMLSPLHPLIVMLFVAALARLTLRMEAGLAAVLAAALTLGVVVPQFRDQRQYLASLAAGDGSNPFPELERLRDVPRRTLIVSSSPDVVYAVAGRPSIATPKRNFVVARRANRCYLRDFAEEVALLRYLGGYVYLTNAAALYGNTTDASELGRFVSLEPVERSRAGALYRVRPDPRAPRPRDLPCRPTLVGLIPPPELSTTPFSAEGPARARR